MVIHASQRMLMNNQLFVASIDQEHNRAYHQIKDEVSNQESACYERNVATCVEVDQEVETMISGHQLALLYPK
jgi:hypothetical protein